MADSSSSSFSYPTAIQTPQNAILDQIAQLAEGYAQQMYAQGQQIYSQTSDLTDQAIQNFLGQAQVGSDFAQNAISRYENLFQPQENQLIQDANTYNSLPRQQFAMGQAEADTAQGLEAGRNNTLMDLRKFGIDPSALEYGALDSEARTQGGAAGAAAGTQARLNTENTGRQLRSQAIAVGQQYPGQAINDMNVAIQGISGAANAGFARANLYPALMSPTNSLLQTAMADKLPPVGNTSRSQQQSSSPAPGGGGKSPKEDKPQDQQGQGKGDITKNDVGQGAGGPGSGGGGSGGGGSGGGNNPGQGPGLSDPETGSAGFPSDFGYNDPNNYGDPYAGYGNNATDGQTSYGDLSGYDPYNYDFGNYTDGSDASWGTNQYNQVDTSPYQYPDTSSYDPNYTADSGTDWSNYNSADSGGGGDWSNDYSGSYDYGGGDFARGGPVGGGRVPPTMSPSRGRQVDDVPAQIGQTGGKANLNVGEFVIPQDVTQWKGQEFFQKMIQQSRKARMGAGARPTRG